MAASASSAAVTVVDDSSPGPFEGPEKLLEIWFAPSEEDVVARNLPLKGGRKGKERWTGLRQVEKSVWDNMLDEVCCKVLSVIEGEEVDAYLLSESSMFVWPHKLILKTCGTTTLLLGIPTLLRIASETCGFKGVWRCFYSRKTFMFPERQRGPHKDWTAEMSFLDKLFENSSAYTVGRMNGDHWLLYITPPSDDVLLPHALESSRALPPATHDTQLSALSASLDTTPSAFPPRRAVQPRLIPSRPDQTLEILMTQLSPAACKKFYHPSSDTPYASYPAEPVAADGDAHALGAKLSDDLGLSAILEGATIDSFLFAPCGFSQNAVRGDRYATVHVTPEEAYSYASFECNFDFAGLGADADRGLETREAVRRTSESLQDLVEKVLAIFEPAKMCITLFVSDEDEDDAGIEKNARAHEGMRQLLNPHLEARYERVDRILYSFDGYSLIFAAFQKKDR
ncbi:adenosylmethionine decarboxylase [Rhodotorula diobovata]|uniref:Adenosylmethionine decarboxylase n=1 Tax=Rhodotorula diobovata TaxID=5288 RepID=A0A5C5FXK9_9BASI|nr:adenosylmethionine decarboxylase [Rhodotorula diobovata]